MENYREHYIIAIDGISGSGKSSTAKIVSDKLGIAYIDTGAMYRALTNRCQNAGIPSTDIQRVIQMASELHFTLAENHKLKLNGSLLGDEIRTSKVSSEVSDYCIIPEVRSLMVKAQRELGQSQPSVVEGRDITTVVFKDAKYKFFFWASAEARALRRTEQLKAKGLKADYHEILHNLQERDAKDSSRAHSPLTQTQDAQLIDTTDMTLENQIELILQQVSEDVVSRN